MNRLLTLLQTFLSLIWNFYRLPFPGTNVPIGAILFLPMVIGLAIGIFRNLFGIGGFASFGDYARSFNTKTRYDNRQSQFYNRMFNHKFKGK